MEDGIYNVTLSGRDCKGCQVKFKQGYVYKVIHPQEGEWNLSHEFLVILNKPGELKYPSVQVFQENNQHNDFKALDRMLEKTQKRPANQEVIHAEQTESLYEKIIEAIDDFPAMNFLLIVVAVLLVMFAIYFFRNNARFKNIR